MNPEESPLNMAALDFEDGRTCYLPTIDQMNDLRLGYAITVHKSQGGEYDTVILPLCEYNRNMLTRNLLYTAISRAKQKVILVGSREMLDYALHNYPKKRNTSLVQKTLQILNNSISVA
jgi:exodeoxyribonuclease V alpha subunit